MPRGAPERAVLDLMGLGARAGTLVFGTGAVRSAVRGGGVHQVVLALDAARGQRAKLVPLLDARQIPYQIAFSQEELGAATGRAPVSAIGFTDRMLAKRVEELLDALRSSGYQQGGE